MIKALIKGVLPEQIWLMLHARRTRIREAAARRRELQRRINRVREFEPMLKVERFDGFEIAFRPDSADEQVISHSFANDIFLAAIPEYSLPEEATVIDVGAHIGTFSLLAARRAAQGKVFAIEACRETCDFLRINVALNRIVNIVVDHLAMYSSKGDVKLYYDPGGNWGHSISKPLSLRGESVASDTLGNYMERHGINRVDLVKLNCEGAEFPILLSTPVKILERIDKMIILYHCDLAEPGQLPKLTDHLSASGYAVEFRHCADERGWIIASRASNL